MTTDETIKKERDMKPMLPMAVLTTGPCAFFKANMLLRGSRALVTRLLSEKALPDAPDMPSH